MCIEASFLGEKLSSSDLLTGYENGNTPLFTFLKENHALLGILLGFGNRNAKLFQKRERIFEDPMQFTIKVPPLPSPWFSDLTEERSFYRSTLQAAFSENAHRTCFKFLYLPGIAADPDLSETQKLREKYLEQRGQIQAVYKHGNFLETTLKKFCLN